MKLKLLTTSDNTEHPGWLKLKASLDKYGYDYEHILHPFSFGHQLPVILNWCNNHSGDYTHICYVDCFDNIALGGPEEVIRKFKEIDCKMLISGEKACYPHPERANDYPLSISPWRFVNGGGWMVEINYFKELCQKENLNQDSHDQLWLMEVFLKNQGFIQVDKFCQIFQTIAFSYKEEWTKGYGRFQNAGTKQFPVFFHGNGRTDMSWLYL